MKVTGKSVLVNTRRFTRTPPVGTGRFSTTTSRQQPGLLASIACISLSATWVVREHGAGPPALGLRSTGLVEVRSYGYVRAEIELNDVPGTAVSVWRKGDIVYAKGFGVRNTARNEPMTANTSVDLASVSKSLTAVAVDQSRR